MRLLLDEPSSSPWAFWLSVCIAMVIICSSITAIIETVPVYYKSQEHTWIVFERFVVSVFTLEFMIRFYANTTNTMQFRKFCRSFYTWMDLVAVLPFYLSIFLMNEPSHDKWSDMQRFTVLRLFRLLRLFRCYTFSSLLQLSIDTLMLSLRKSVDALLALLVFITFIMVAFSTLIYFAERGVWDAKQRAFIDVEGQISQFGSIPASAWFVAEIITTVGLGDIHPKTNLGRIIAVLLMMFSLLIIALPSIVIGRNFAESWAWLRSTRPMRPLPSAPLSPVGGTASRTSGPQLSSPTTFRGNGETLHFLAEPSSAQQTAQASVNLGSESTTNQFYLPAPFIDVEEHGEVMLGILQELQRQNELLERLLLAQSGPHLQPQQAQPCPPNAS